MVFFHPSPIRDLRDLKETADWVAEAVLKRDRLVVLSGLAVITLLSWAYMVYLARDMQQMGMEMSRMPAWDVVDLVLMFVMWTIMMVAMMTPSAAPIALTFAALNRRRRAQQSPYVPTSVFLLGYLIVWTAFSALAAAAQWGLQAAALLSPTMVSTSPLLGGALLVAAGIFQWTPFKDACLRHCRSPMGFLLSQWREGSWGALRMGLKHGNYCLGCCWLLMVLPFVGGVMNLLWMAAITAFVLIEKVAPSGNWVGRLTGLLLIGWGAWMVAGAL